VLNTDTNIGAILIYEKDNEDAMDDLMNTLQPFEDQQVIAATRPVEGARAGAGNSARRLDGNRADRVAYVDFLRDDDDVMAGPGTASQNPPRGVQRAPHQYPQAPRRQGLTAGQRT
jgi:hypothetical protein